MRMSINSRLSAITLIACVGLIAGPAHADTIWMPGGFWVNVYNNTTFFTTWNYINAHSFSYSNGSGLFISGNESRSDSDTLLFTADPGKWFTTVSVGIYGWLHVGGDANGSKAYAYDALSLAGGASYGPVSHEWSDYLWWTSGGYGSNISFTWPGITVNASSFTITLSEILQTEGEATGGGGPSSLTPNTLFFDVALGDAPAESVPDPSTLLLLGSGLAGLVGCRRFWKA